MKIAVLLAVFCYAQLTSGVTHRLQYFYTATTGISNFPAFVDVGVVDGVAVSRYDSNTQKKVPLQRWMEENFDQQYWESSTTNLKGTEQWFKYYIETAKKRFNHTGGVHTFQRMYGCQWDDETQAIDGFDQYGYDGKDFITFDLKNLHYIAPVPENLITKQKLDTNTALLEGQKHYYTQTCIDWLKKYVQYGSSTLGRKVAPEVSLLQKDSGVACHATGFYPEGVMITWKKDGEKMQDDVDVGETLPNEDGTFQKRAVLTVSPEERKKGQYSCEITHKSGGPIVMVFEEANHLPIIIAVCVVAAVALVAGIVAVVIMKKRGYTKAPQSDTSSDTSNGAPKA